MSQLFNDSAVPSEETTTGTSFVEVVTISPALPNIPAGKSAKIQYTMRGENTNGAGSFRYAYCRVSVDGGLTSNQQEVKMNANQSFTQTKTILVTNTDSVAHPPVFDIRVTLVNEVTAKIMTNAILLVHSFTKTTVTDFFRKISLDNIYLVLFSGTAPSVEGGTAVAGQDITIPVNALVTQIIFSVNNVDCLFDYSGIDIGVSV